MQEIDESDNQNNQYKRYNQLYSLSYMKIVEMRLAPNANLCYDYIPRS